MSQAEGKAPDSASTSTAEKKQKNSFLKRLVGTLGGKTEDDDISSVKPVSIRELLRYAKSREIFLLTMGVIFAILNGMILPWLIIFAGWISSVFITTKDPIGNAEFLQSVLIYSFMLLGAGIASFLCAFLEHLTLATATERITARIKIVFITAVLGQDSTFLDGTSAGALSNQLNNNIDRIRDGLGDKVGMLFRPDLRDLYRAYSRALRLLHVCYSQGERGGEWSGRGGILNKYARILKTGVSPAVRVGAISGFFEGIFFFILYLFFVGGVWWGTVAYHDGLIDEPGTVLAAPDLIQFSSYLLGLLGPHMLTVLKARSAAAVVYQTIDRKTILRALFHALNQSFSFFSNFLANVLGAYLVYIGMVSALDLFTSRMCIVLVGWGVMFMSGSLNDLINSREAAKKVFSLMDPDWAGRRDGEEPDLSGSVAFKNVFFAYPSRPAHNVTSDLNFKLKSGESLALVGPSGGGKSTVVALLERFYEPTRGNIELDSNPLCRMSFRHLRSNIALVGQEPVLFRGTIMENITMGTEETTIEKVVEACRLANAASFIEQFPLGYETVVGEKGSSLSGGQKQRIAIARAMIRRPKIILLDEATSALDTQSEQVVRQALEATAVGRTSITIAHRLDTIANCDRICFIEKGKIVETGTHKELLDADGKYAALVREQKLS